MPQTRSQLDEAITFNVQQHGPQCSLNHAVALGRMAARQRATSQYHALDAGLAGAFVQSSVLLARVGEAFG